MTSLYEYNHDKSYFGYNWVGGGTNDNKWLAQTFIIGNVGTNENFILDSVHLMLSNASTSPDGNMTVRIKEMSNRGWPDGSTVDTNYFDTSVLDEEEEEYTLLMVNNKVLKANTPYSILFYYNTVSPSDKMVAISGNEGDCYSGGSVWYRVGSTWYPDELYDIWFEVWGHTTYNTYAISTPIDYNNGTITTAKLTGTGTGFYNFWMTADGTNWEKVITNVAHNFTNTGTDLRWKAGGLTGSKLTSVSVTEYH